MTQRRPLRVLLVDDDPDLLQMLQVVLTSPTLEVVGLAGNGEDAVRVAEAIAPDVAVVDYMMPDIDGFETARRLKALLPDCETVIFSALDIEADAVAHPSVDHFLSKREVLSLDSVLREISAELGLAR